MTNSNLKSSEHERMRDCSNPYISIELSSSGAIAVESPCKSIANASRKNNPWAISTTMETASRKATFLRPKINPPPLNVIYVVMRLAISSVFIGALKGRAYACAIRAVI